MGKRWIIKNGRILDPASGIDTFGDVVISGRNIERLVPGGVKEPIEADQNIDASGMLVVPGLIDVHMHINYMGQANGAPADLTCIPNGVTAAIDAGSTGVSNYRACIQSLSRCDTKTKIMLNVSACGIIMPTWFPEPVDPVKWDTDYFDEAFALYGKDIVGLKLRISKNVVGDLGTKPLEAALKLAERYDTRLIVHSTDPVIEMGLLASILRPGDVITHIHQGKGETIIKDGRVDVRIIEAQKRGVIMDCSNGKFNVSLNVAKQAIEEGFLPDTISTDLNVTNWRSPWVFSLPIIMSKYLALGVPLSKVIECTTAAAAIQFGEVGNLGTLSEGTTADITILELKEKSVEYRDIWGGRVKGNHLLIPRGTILNGKTVYLSNECFGW